ncbi:MAG: hypothetical protein WCI92_17100 [Bacteroidota bacterium]
MNSFNAASNTNPAHQNNILPIPGFAASEIICSFGEVNIPDFFNENLAGHEDL